MKHWRVNHDELKISYLIELITVELLQIKDRQLYLTVHHHTLPWLILQTELTLFIYRSNSMKTRFLIGYTAFLKLQYEYLPIKWLILLLITNCKFGRWNVVKLHGSISKRQTSRRRLSFNLNKKRWFALFREFRWITCHHIIILEMLRLGENPTLQR